MSCSGCGKRHASVKPAVEQPVVKTTTLIAGASNDPTKKVRLLYYGGGTTAKKVAKCAVCGSAGNSYSRVTSETIMFVSEDAPNGLFKQLMNAGHSYWVTEKQAEYLLANEFYINQSGERVCKFKRLD